MKLFLDHLKKTFNYSDLLPIESNDEAVYKSNNSIIKISLQPNNEYLILKTLKENGFPVPRIIRYEPDVEFSYENKKHWYHFLELETLVDDQSEKYTHQYYSELGISLGLIHTILSQIDETELVNCKRKFETGDTQIQRRYNELYRVISSYSQNPKNYGLTHSDFHSLNIAIHNKITYVFDFSDSAEDFFVVDLLNILYEIYTASINNKNKSNWETFLDNYLKVHPIDIDFHLCDTMMKINNLWEVYFLTKRNQNTSDYFEQLLNRTFSDKIDEVVVWGFA